MTNKINTFYIKIKKKIFYKNKNKKKILNYNNQKHI